MVLLAVSYTLRENAKQVIGDPTQYEKEGRHGYGRRHDRTANTTANKLRIMMVSSQVSPETKA